MFQPSSGSFSGTNWIVCILLSGPRFLWSAQHGNLDELSRLLAVSQDLINFKDEDGYTALHRASYSHQAAAVLFLLKNGADIHSTTEEGKKSSSSSSK